MSISLLGFARWIYLISGFIQLIVIYSMGVSRVGPVRIIVAQRTELHGGIPTGHERGAVSTSGGE
jgi:hypothetical protein